MKSSVINSVSFNPVARTIDTGISNFDIRKLYAIINMTKSKLIYATGKQGLGFSNIDDSIITLEFDTDGARMGSTDIIQIIYEDDFDTNLQESLLYFITALAKKLPRIDNNDRQVVSVETGTVSVNSLPTLNTVGAIQNFSGGNTSAIPNHIANVGANHIYDRIKIT